MNALGKFVNGKNIGIAAGSVAACIGTLYVGKRLGFFGATDSASNPVLAKMAKAEEDAARSIRYPSLSPASAVALEEDDTLSDLVDRLQQYFKFNEELGLQITDVASQAAEYLLRLHEVERKKSIPATFGAFTRQLVMLCRRLRTSVREQQPQLLEEYDELVDEVVTYKNDMHHNLWCDANSS
jgi:uncharacterized membrane protein YccC